MIEHRDLIVSNNTTVREALQRMNTVGRKLLIVFDQSGKYLSVISIGDLQRYLINHQEFEAPISIALRENTIYSTFDEELSSIKKKMIKHRIEFMPVLGPDKQLEKVIFWEEIISETKKTQRGNLSCPVIVMAGGKGTRLRPLTHVIPKPLIPIGEKPIAEIIVDQFVEAGSKDFHFSVGYKSEMIQAYFDNIEGRNYDVNYFFEDKPLGTAGSLALIKDKIKETFFVTNCDVIIEQDYEDIYSYHVENKNQLTAVAFVKDMKIPYGTFEVTDENILTSLKEKPEFTFLVNAGMYILEPELLEKIPFNEFYHITHLMEAIIEDGGRVGVFPINEGSWLDIGQWKEYQKTLEHYGHAIQF